MKYSKGYANNYNVGDIVTVRRDLLSVNRDRGVMICGSMYQHAGQQIHIVGVGKCELGDYYTVKENLFKWQDHMLEPVGNIDMTAMDSLLLRGKNYVSTR